jgi:hypothetical protein
MLQYDMPVIVDTMKLCNFSFNILVLTLAAEKNEAIRDVISNRHEEVVKLLLQDTRVATSFLARIEQGQFL